MADIIDFQKYKNAEDNALEAATIIVKEISGELIEEEILKTHAKIPTKYLTTLMFALDVAIDEADIPNANLKELEMYSDTLGDMINKRMNDLGVEIVDD